MEGLGDAQVEKNLVGTVQVEPEASVVDAKVRWLSGVGSSRNMDVNDFHVAGADEEVVKQIAEQLDLRELADLQSKLRRLKQWYLNEFRYTLDLTIRQSTPIGRIADDNVASALEQFLTEVRAGHCEYFATSATLILRASGVAARYTTGFGVMEKSDNENEYLLRGAHAHAWVRVWDEQKQTWIDFDPTPPDWMEGNVAGLSWSQKIKDVLKRIREDFFLWRTNPDNEMVVVMVVSLFAIALGLVVVRRLWRSRSRIQEGSRITAFGGIQQNTPLHDLESLIRRCVGQRPAGMTYVRWLRAVEDESGELKGLDEAIRLHQQWRFDTKPVGKPDQQRLRELVESLEHALRCKLSERQKT